MHFPGMDDEKCPDCMRLQRKVERLECRTDRLLRILFTLARRLSVVEQKLAIQPEVEEKVSESTTS